MALNHKITLKKNTLAFEDDVICNTTVVTNITQLDQSLRDLRSYISCKSSYIDYHDAYSFEVPSSFRCVVGLGVEKLYYDEGDQEHRVAEKVAVVKLCYNCKCLLIQLLQIKEPPCSLAEFLQHEALTFVGVGMNRILEALNRDYGIKCSNAVDLGRLAATVNKSEAYNSLGLIDLTHKLCPAERVDGLLIYYKGRALSSENGNWDCSTTLSIGQIEAATNSAYLCFYIGNSLLLEHDYS